MSEEDKKGIFSKIFGKKSCCCSFHLEDIENENVPTPDNKNEISGSNCCSNMFATKSSEEQRKDDKK